MNSINLSELNQLLKSTNGVTVIDVRSEEEFKGKHIPFAVNFPIGKIETKSAVFDLNKPIVTVCGNGGGRSERAAGLIRGNYGADAVFLEEGTFGWIKNNHEINVENKTFIQKLIERGHLPEDSEDVKLKKSILLLMTFPFAVLGCLWGALYIYNDLFMPGMIPFSYGILSLISVGIFLTFQNFNFFRFSQLLLVLLLPFFLQISLGGFIPSSAVIIWSVLCPLGALAFYQVKKSRYWFGAFLLIVVASFFVNDYLPDYFNRNLSEKFINGFLLMNILGISFLIYLLQYYFFSKQAELKKSVEQKSKEILENNREITDSIKYAKRIQQTLLANEQLLKKNLQDYFILYKPKDIVSGDFYWATERVESSRFNVESFEQSSTFNFQPPTSFYLAVCDSTGHGVPGAFMSLLNISFLNEAINERNLVLPNEICDHVRKRLIDNISQDGGQDGMDGVLISLDNENKKLSFAAAHNAPVLIRKNNVIEFEADKMPIGKGERSDNFRQQNIDIEEGDLFYLYTDGYTDQFGGPKGKKFKYSQMKALLQSICNQPLIEQKKILDDIITNWKGNMEQTDDILIIGFKIQ